MKLCDSVFISCYRFLLNTALTDSKIDFLHSLSGRLIKFVQCEYSLFLITVLQFNRKSLTTASNSTSCELNSTFWICFP